MRGWGSVQPVMGVGRGASGREETCCSWAVMALPSATCCSRADSRTALLWKEECGVRGREGEEGMAGREREREKEGARQSKTRGGERPHCSGRN